MFEAIKELFRPQGVTFDKEWPDFRMYAIRRHGDQRYGNFPYAYHLSMVECILIDYGFNTYEFQAAAWLHDILEDTSTKLDQINANYGPVVAALVYSVTGKGNNRKERNRCIYENIQKYPQAAVLKIADRIANISHCVQEVSTGGNTDKLEMYLSEWNDFKTNLYPLMEDTLQSRLMWMDLENLIDRTNISLKELKIDKEDKKKREEVKDSFPPVNEERTKR